MELALAEEVHTSLRRQTEGRYKTVALAVAAAAALEVAVKGALRSPWAVRAAILAVEVEAGLADLAEVAEEALR
jgi:hypothetical protein